MDRAQTLDAINRLEENHPVEAWRGRGVHVWPIVRSAIAGRSFRGYVEARRNRPPPRMERARALPEMAGTALRSAAANARDREHRASTRGGCDVAILGVTEAVGRVRLEGTWYDRLTDPLRELLARRGLSSVHLAPGRRFLVPRHDACAYVQPALDRAALRTLRPAWPGSELELPGFDELVAAAREAGLGTEDITLGTVGRQIRLVWGMADTYERLLRRIGAEAAFVVSYGLSSMAFNLACHRVGIPSIEIQHGVQGPLHWAYARWAALPPGGYELLPSSYWVWSAEEAAVIERWAGTAHPRHRAVPGGNLWLDAWRRGGGDFEATERRVRRAKERSPGERHVLIPLHRALASRSSLRPFAEAVAARPGWRWWVRSHPGMSAGEVARAKAILGEAPGARLELEASELPLYAVLRQVDAVATMASSVVLEAAVLGTPSAITDADLGDQYAAEIAAGWAVLAGGSLAQALESQIERAVALPAYERRRIEPEAALEELLPGSPGRSSVA